MSGVVRADDGVEVLSGNREGERDESRCVGASF